MASLDEAANRGDGPSQLRLLVFWRHGRTGFNTEHRFQGHLDPPLDAEGRRQAEAAAGVLAGLRPALLLSSDLSRAAQTAAELARVTGVPVVYDSRLREYDVGLWQGLTHDELASRFPVEYEAWLAGVHPPGWETPFEVAERVSTCVEEALTGVGNGEIMLVVSHGGAIRALTGTLLGLAPSDWWRLSELGNCHWSVLAERSRGWTLVEHNAHAPTADADATTSLAGRLVAHGAEVR